MAHVSGGMWWRIALLMLFIHVQSHHRSCGVKPALHSGVVTVLQLLQRTARGKAGSDINGRTQASR